MLMADWEHALDRAAAVMAASTGPAVALFGGRASCETIGWTLRALDGRAVTAAMQVPLGEEAPLAGIPGLALRRERAANLHGARWLGADAEWGAALTAAASAAVVVLVDATLSDADADALRGAGTVIHLATVADPRLPALAVVLPITSVAEEQGVFVNRDGRAQRFLPALTPRGLARPGWWVASRLWAHGATERTAPDTASEAFGALAPFGGLGYRDLGYTGRVLTPDMAEAR
jgi:NADH-quinone oxidoreductase subunit G